jgi:hypothetical protein
MPATTGSADMIDVLMQQVQVSSGIAHCQYCGEQIAVNRLSIHIAKEHARPSTGDMSPKLVRKPVRG